MDRREFIGSAAVAAALPILPDVANRHAKRGEDGHIRLSGFQQEPPGTVFLYTELRCPKEGLFHMAAHRLPPGTHFAVLFAKMQEARDGVVVLLEFCPGAVAHGYTVRVNEDRSLKVTYAGEIRRAPKEMA